jgi:hypothetical protein
MGMADDIVALLELFRGRVPDPETNAWVLALAKDRRKWPDAHRLFDLVRQRTLTAISAKDRDREGQYAFEEICLKSLYNETDALGPFDSDSPHWITKCALGLARGVGLNDQAVLDIILPRG